MKKNIAVYAGTFDPITNGHLDIIERASSVFDTLYVTIFVNLKKQGLLDIDERVALIKEATRQFDNVVVDYSSKLAVEYAKDVKANVLVRGIRATMDFEYELQMAFANQYLEKDIEMVFFMARQTHAFISSSTVKEIVAHGRSVKDLVPECVEMALYEKYEKKEIADEYF